jgi:hypothetical protein
MLPEALLTWRMTRKLDTKRRLLAVVETTARIANLALSELPQDITHVEHNKEINRLGVAYGVIKRHTAQTPELLESQTSNNGASHARETSRTRP